MGLAFFALGMTAFLTAALSAILGMGGGSLLLVAAGSFLAHAETIPAHATAQIVGLSTRVFAFRESVHWVTVVRFSAGSLPGAAIGGWLLWTMGGGVGAGGAEPYLKGAIGAYILVVTFLPAPTSGTAAGRAWEWTAVGLAAGTAGIFVGAVGPMIAPLFVRHALLKEKLIATKALCQAILHAVKLPIFLFVGGFQIAKFSVLLAVMAGATVPGTYAGKWLLGRVPERAFLRLYQAALILTAGKLLVFDCVAALWSAPPT